MRLYRVRWSLDYAEIRLEKAVSRAFRAERTEDGEIDTVRLQDLLLSSRPSEAPENAVLADFVPGPDWTHCISSRARTMIEAAAPGDSEFLEMPFVNLPEPRYAWVIHTTRLLIDETWNSGTRWEPSEVPWRWDQAERINVCREARFRHHIYCTDHLDGFHRRYHSGELTGLEFQLQAGSG